MLENFLLDFIILLLSMRLSQKRTSLGRCAAGGAVGGVYAVLAALFQPLRLLPCKLVGLALMSAAVFLPSSWRSYLRSTGYVLFTGLIFGGGAAMAYYAMDAAGLRTTVSAQVMAICDAGIAIAAVTAELVIRRRHPETNRIYHVEAELLGERIAFDAMLDTGNDVRDFSGNGVIMADEDTVLAAISDQLRESILSLDGRVAARPFYCTTVNGSGRHIGFLPDSMTVSTGGDIYQAKAYILLGRGIRLGDCRGILGNGLVMEKRR